ncbi:MAG: hydroxymethylbilane synthase [Acidimicrobiales bacterium]|nr:hydroxymethylbilane synthase [Acidimicrobiales bacterium]
MHIRAATRGSVLARWQAARIADLIGAARPETTVEIVVVETTGDRDLATPLEQMGGHGVFVKEVQAAVLDGRADVAVHSAKDLPAVTPEGLMLAAVPERADPRDAIVGHRWEALAEGATVATGSIRRRAHLGYLRPDLVFKGLRGNIGTRLLALEGPTRVDAIVVAAAALDRLDLAPTVLDRLDPSVLLPQVGQGALAVECRASDADVNGLLAAIDDPVAHRAVAAERAFLSELGAGCDLPVAAYAVLPDGLHGDLHLTGSVSSNDGTILLREERVGSDGPRMGRTVARFLLDDQGGASLLAR